MIDRRALLALVATGPTLAASTPAGAAEAKPIVIPFLLTLDRVIMLVGVNGKGPFRFVVDTGDSGPMQITAELARTLGMPGVNSGGMAGVVGHGERALLAADEVNFGGAFRQRHVGFAEITDIRNLGAGTQGLVASQFFLNVPTEIDFNAHQIRVFLTGTPDRTDAKPLKLIRPSGANDRRIMVDCTFGDAPCRMILDTGSPSALLFEPRFVARHNLWNAYPKYQVGASGGLTGSAPVRTVKVPRFGLGPYSFRDPVARLIDPTAEAAGEHDGLVGLDILRRFTLSFDAPHGMLWLTPNDALTDAYRIDKSGLNLVFDPRAGEARVTHVEPGSAAQKAGLRVGDRVTGISSASQADALRWRLRGFPGDPVELDLVRPRGTEKVTVVLQDPL
jgi:hypothetical protein